MIDEDWQPRPEPADTQGVALHVAAVVPLPGDAGGEGEVLVLSAFGNMKLPQGQVRANESLQRAVKRVTLGSTGAEVTPDRLLYVVEQAGKQVTLCFLCTLDGAEDVETKPGVRFASVGSDADFEPVAVRELLVEDARGGFIRPTAYVSSFYNEDGKPTVAVTW